MCPPPRAACDMIKLIFHLVKKYSMILQKCLISIWVSRIEQSDQSNMHSPMHIFLGENNEGLIR